MVETPRPKKLPHYPALETALNFDQVSEDAKHKARMFMEDAKM